MKTLENVSWVHSAYYMTEICTIESSESWVKYDSNENSVNRCSDV